jgi:eukaryotic-like serine/threonine-protein kinase
MNAWPNADEFLLINEALRELLAMDASERAQHLDAWCQSHADMAARMRHLINVAEPESCSEGLPTRMQWALSNSMMQATAIIPAQIGDWQLRRFLGAGGMAEVWLADGCNAHQGQQAAIKRPSAGMATRGGVERFERERTLLAGLSDPRIARLIDSGVDAMGHPWLAMEFVDGMRIDHWCDQRLLDLAGRARLVCDVALAVHSAHSALIVHRDIKPANVLVNDAGAVKLLDFGIAKLLSPDPAAQAATLSLALTPQYASPEQFLGQTISTASDIYQLGILLTELLAGDVQFPTNCESYGELADAVLGACGRLPSDVFAAAPKDKQDLIARRRGLRDYALPRQLRGDLDAIVSKATARAPLQRYASALQLADDLHAWLAHQPVRARAPTRRYRLQKMMARNAAACVISALLFFVMVAFVSTTLIQAQRLRLEAQNNVQVRDYVIQVLRQTDPFYAQTPAPTTSALLDQALKYAREQFSEQPALLADVLVIGADSASRQGDFVRSAKLLHEAVLLGKDRHDARQTAIAQHYGEALHYLGRFAESEKILRVAQDEWYARGAVGSPRIAPGLVDLLHSRGDYASALAILEKLDKLPLSTYARASWQGGMGTVLRDSADPRARVFLASSLTTFSNDFPNDHAAIAMAQLALGRLEAINGNSHRARELIAPAMRILQNIYGQYHGVIGAARHTLALADMHDGQWDIARTRLNNVLMQDYASIPDGNVLRAYAHLDLAWCEIALQQNAQAISDLDAAQKTLKFTSANGHPKWAEAQLARAVLAIRVGDRAAASSFIDTAIVARTNQFGAQHPLSLEARHWQEVLAHSPRQSATRDLAAVRWQLLVDAMNEVPFARR